MTIEQGTVEKLLRRFDRMSRTIKVLRDDNRRLRESREEWKRKYREREAEIVSLRRQRQRLRESRDMWRSRVTVPTRRRRERSPNVLLSHHEILRIMRMPVRK